MVKESMLITGGEVRPPPLVMGWRWGQASSSWHGLEVGSDLLLLSWVGGGVRPPPLGMGGGGVRPPQGQSNNHGWTIFWIHNHFFKKKKETIIFLNNYLY